jgi:adenine-specific DNA-methyltransferase
LRHAVVFDSDKGVFDGAVTTACVLLLAKDGKGGRGGGEVAFHRTAGVGELSALYRASVAPGRISRAGASRAGDPSEAPAPTVLKAEDMDPGAKWRGYWKKTSLAGYRHMAPLGERFLVLRGIATGSNAFFVLGEAERLEAGLPEDCLLPCVAKARDAAGPLFTLRDHAALREGGRPAFLLDAEGRDHPAVKAYLEAGVRAGVDRRFLTRNRRCWYALENRPPAPLWFPVFARGIRRPVLNRAGVRNLTAFHCVYPRPGAEDLIDPLFLWLLTGTGGALARDNAREYGAGLEKVEPKDLAETPGPDFARMGEEDLAALRGLVRRFEEEGPAAEADIARAASAIFAARLE